MRKRKKRTKILKEKYNGRKPNQFSLEVSPFIGSHKEIYININEYPQVPII